MDKMVSELSILKVWYNKSTRKQNMNKTNKPLIIAVATNILLYVNLLYWLFLLLIMICISLLVKLEIVNNLADFVMAFIIFAVPFSIINWFLKPIILIKTYQYIIKNHPNNNISKWLKNDIKNKKTRKRLFLILIILEILWFLLAYLFYKTANIIPPHKYALFLYLIFGGGILEAHIGYFLNLAHNK